MESDIDLDCIVKPYSVSDTCGRRGERDVVYFDTVGTCL